MNGWKKHGTLLLSGVLMLSVWGCQKEGNEEVHSFAVWKKTEENAYTFEDGITADKWVNEDDSVEQYRYRLADGTDLLEETVMPTLDQAPGQYLEGMDSLDSSVQKIIREYYERQGLLFGEDEMLEQAYQDYLWCEANKEKFTYHEVSQDISETAETSRYIVFLTAVKQPKTEHYTGDATQRYQNVIFDRSTGETIDLWDIFTLPEEEVKEQLVQLCAVEDTTVSEEDIRKVIDQADILLFQDYIEVWFPYGTWEKQEFDKGFGFEYEKLENLMYPWAIPEKEDSYKNDGRG